MALSFAFDTSKGETPESVRRKRDMIRSLLGAQRAPQNVGEGLNALGDGIVAAILDGRADKAESAGLASANSVFGTLTGGGGAFPTAPGGQSTPFDGDLRSGILSSAEALGIDPVDLATAISYETGGTMDPLKYGPTTQWGRHRGLIQFGEPQAAENGVDWNNPLGSQLGPEGAVVKYLRSAGVKPGMGLLDVYSAINAGAPGLYDRTDENNGGAPGTVRDKVEKQMGSHRAKALALMGGQNQVASLDPSIGLPPAPGTPPASAGTAPAIDPYSKIPALDGRGEDQRAKFRMWNPDPIGGEGANLAAVDPALRKVIERAKQLTDQRFVLGSGKRSQELQKKAVEWGWSKTLDSDHAGGGATDLWPLDEDGAVVFDKARQAKIVEAMDKASRELGVDLDVGARWRSFKDRPHFAVIGQTPMEGPIPQARPGTQVASLDPSAGLADAQGGAVEAPPPPGVQIAQALSGTPEMAGNAPSGRRQPSIPELLGGLGNEWMSPARQKILGVMLERQMQREDPAYGLGLEKARTELDLLKNPRLSPYEAQQIELKRAEAEAAAAKAKQDQSNADRTFTSEDADRAADNARADQELNIKQLEYLLKTQPDFYAKYVQQEEEAGRTPLGVLDYATRLKGENKPSAVQEYEYAKAQGFAGTFQDWEASKKGGMSLQVDPATGAVTFQQGQNIKPLTEGQSKDTVFSTRAAGALPLIDKYGDALTSLGQEALSGIPILGNYLRSDEHQQAEQAGKEFLQAILRKDTGAAITPAETSEYGTVYLPRPGDSGAVLAQKKQSRERALKAIEAGMPPQAILAQEKALSESTALPEGVTEEDIQHTMKLHGVTREQVLERLRGGGNAP